MQLKYSLNGIEPHWFFGNLPFPEMRMERVKIRLTGRAALHFPPFVEIGDLLCRRKGEQCAITLRLMYHHSTVPTGSPTPMNRWYPVPGSPIYCQIQIALTPEATKQIRKVLGDDYDYEMTLEDVDLVDITKK